MLGRPPNSIRVIAPDVGGGFGAKGGMYPDELVAGADGDGAWPAGPLGLDPDGRPAVHDAGPRPDQPGGRGVHQRGHPDRPEGEDDLQRRRGAADARRGAAAARPRLRDRRLPLRGPPRRGVRRLHQHQPDRAVSRGRPPGGRLRRRAGRRGGRQGARPRPDRGPAPQLHPARSSSRTRRRAARSTTAATTSWRPAARWRWPATSSFGRSSGRPASAARSWASASPRPSR